MPWCPQGRGTLENTHLTLMHAANAAVKSLQGCPWQLLKHAGDGYCVWPATATFPALARELDCMCARCDSLRAPGMLPRHPLEVPARDRQAETQKGPPQTSTACKNSNRRFPSLLWGYYSRGSFTYKFALSKFEI